MMDSLCADPRFCVLFDHRHCSIDGAVIDHHNGDFEICVECKDDHFLLCPSCAKQDPRCAACRKAVAA